MFNLNNGTKSLPHVSYKEKIRRSNSRWVWALSLSSLGLVATMIAAWVTHVVICIKTASWVLLVIGAVVFPVGIIHGVGYWFGAF
jgi:hypothetical protein